MEHSPGLKLYKCFHCRRSFFSASSRQIHCSAVHGTKIPGHEKNTAAGRTSNGRARSVNKMWKRYRKSSGKYETVFATLLGNWPPESALRKICMKHKMTHRRAQLYLNRMLSPDYKNCVHGTKCPEGTLLSEYGKNKNISKKRTKDISSLTGISCQFVRFWFMWRNLIKYPTWKDHVMHGAFRRQHHPDDEMMLGLVADNGFSLPEIRSWFRVARAKSNVLELREVEEKLLWKWLHLHPNSSLEKDEVADVARLVGMTWENVQTILHSWQNFFNSVEEELQRKNTNKRDEYNPSSTTPSGGGEAAKHSAGVTDSDNVLNSTRASWKELSNITFTPYVEAERKKSWVKKKRDLPENTTDSSEQVVFEERNLEDDAAHDVRILQSRSVQVPTCGKIPEIKQKLKEKTAGSREILDKSLQVQNHVLQPELPNSISCKGSEDEDRLFVLFNNSSDDERRVIDPACPDSNRRGDIDVVTDGMMLDPREEGSADAAEFHSFSNLNMEYEYEDENEEELDVSSDYEVQFVKQIFPAAADEVIDLTMDDQDEECSDGKQEDRVSATASRSLDHESKDAVNTNCNMLPGTMIKCENEANFDEDAHGDDSSPQALRICLSEDEDDENVETLENNELKASQSSSAENQSNLNCDYPSVQHSLQSIIRCNNNNESRVNVTHKSKRKIHTPKRLVQPHHIQVKKRHVTKPMHISKSLFAKSWKQCQESPTMAVRRRKMLQLPGMASESRASLKKGAGTSNREVEHHKSVTEDLKRVINSLETWLNNNVSEEDS